MKNIVAKQKWSTVIKFCSFHDSSGISKFIYQLCAIYEMLSPIVDKIKNSKTWKLVVINMLDNITNITESQTNKGLLSYKNAVASFYYDHSNCTKKMIASWKQLFY